MKTFICLLLGLCPSLVFSNTAGDFSKMSQYTYDSNHVRYEHYQSNDDQPLNWLFLPGGPGADSSYLHSLIDELDLPGNVWLVDLPGNGDNLQSQPDDFDHWLRIFPSIFQQFDNPVLVGHSFGGMFPLLFPDLENQLKGLVILNSSPKLWLEEVVAYSKQFDLPDLTPAMQEFTLNPSPETFKIALDACMPYYFPTESLEKGIKILSQVPFQYLAAVWWQRKVVELNFSAKWIPAKVPTLIVGGKYDCVCPFVLFEKDQRFQRANVELLFIDNAGHLPWVENPAALREAFQKMSSRLVKSLTEDAGFSG